MSCAARGGGAGRLRKVSDADTGAGEGNVEGLLQAMNKPTIFTFQYLQHISNVPENVWKCQQNALLTSGKYLEFPAIAANSVRCSMENDRFKIPMRFERHFTKNPE